LEFQVFKDGKVDEDFTVSGAYLFGTDGIAIRRAHIAARNGIITCRRANLESAGLALLWPIEGFGKVLLPTTCLPPKKTPYSLNVELARGKLMQILKKREDWSFFNNIEGLEQTLNEARDLFIRALQNIATPALASKLADESLKKAAVCSEKLALRQAESLLRTRGRSRGFGRRCLGCRVDPRKIADDNYVKKLVASFSFVTIPANWGQIEPQKGAYNFSQIDACMQILAKKRLAICIGPLLCFKKEYLPKWLLRGHTGFEKIREAAYRFVYKVITRYGGSVHAWRIVTGLNAFNHFGFTFEQILEMTRAATMAVKAGGNRGVKIVELVNPWGEYYANTPDTIPPLVYMDTVVQSGISFDAFGLQLRFGRNQPGMHVRDMMQISNVLEYFGALAKPLYITEVEVPGANGTGPQDPQAAGIWHEQWSGPQQGKWIQQFYKIALSKPFIDTVTYAHLVDNNANLMTDSGLFTRDLQPKLSFHVLQNLKSLICSRQDSRK